MSKPVVYALLTRRTDHDEWLTHFYLMLSEEGTLIHIEPCGVTPEYLSRYGMFDRAQLNGVANLHYPKGYTLRVEAAPYSPEATAVLVGWRLSGGAYE